MFSVFKIAKNLLNVFLSLILVFNYSLNLEAKEPSIINPGFPPVNPKSEVQIMQRFVEVWNSSENLHRLLLRFRIESKALSRIEKDLKTEKIFKSRLPELEYSPAQHVLWIKLGSKKEQILILNKKGAGVDEKPVLYTGFKFHQLNQKGDTADNYFKIKTALQQSMIEVEKTEKDMREIKRKEQKKKKSVSQFDFLLSALLVYAKAESLISIPFVGEKEKKTNWIPWIALGGVFSLLALWKGVDYFLVGNNKAEAANNEAQVGSAVGSKDDVLEEESSLKSEEKGPALNTGAGEKINPRLVITDKFTDQDLSNLDPIAEIDKGLQMLESTEHLLIKKMNCDGSAARYIVFEKLGSKPRAFYTVPFRGKNKVLSFVDGQSQLCAYEFIGDGKFKNTEGQRCPTDKDEEMLFIQQNIFLNLQENIAKCCLDAQCKPNMSNLIGVDTNSSDQSSQPKITNDGASAK